MPNVGAGSGIEAGEDSISLASGGVSPALLAPGAVTTAAREAAPAVPR